MPTESLPRAVRRRAREEIVVRIVEAARRQLATEGAAGLSLRAVARELGMVSSAVYRYVASRDELLTLLILDGYNAMGAAVEDAEREVPRDDLPGRWLAICHGARDWAFGHPHEYALLYGSPVPGYVAPQDTVAAASRVTALLATLLQDILEAEPDVVTRLEADGFAVRGGRAGIPVPVVRAIRPIRLHLPDDVPDELVLRGLAAWVHLIGSVTFELFGHLHQVVDDDPGLRRAYFAQEMTRLGQLTGLRSVT